MNLAESILAQGEPDATSIISGAQVVTYAQLRRATNSIAHELLTRGHKKGDRIAICSENSPFFVSAYLGIILAGMVAVPLPVDLSEQTFSRILSDAQIREVFVSKRHINRLSQWASNAGVHLVSEPGFDQHESDPGPVAPPELDPIRDLAALMFTSGSTGVPKGVMVSHRNIECNTRDIISYLGLTARDRVMVVLPFHYCFGLSLLHSHLMAGGSLVLNNTFKLYPELMLQEMQRTQCTGFAGVPSTYQLLLKKSRFCSMAFPNLRCLQQAGGKLPNPLIQQVTAAVPNARFFLMYGQTEATARLSYLPPERLGDKLGSIGRGLPSTRLEVLKPEGTSVQPGSDETGEIVASGDNVCRGYWNDPVETANYFRNGKLYTGDIAKVDNDGFIYVVERERDMIKSGGNRVSSKEIEDIIAEIPDVMEAAVVGSPHELLGEAITAFIVPVSRATVIPADVQKHCRSRLAAFKVPETVILLDAMPHNDAGKVLKAKLKEMAALLPSPHEQKDPSAPLLQPLGAGDRAAALLES